MVRDKIIVLLAAIILSTVVAVCIYLVKTFGWQAFIFGACLLLALFLVSRLLLKKIRYSRLIKKYDDEIIVN